MNQNHDEIEQTIFEVATWLGNSDAGPDLHVYEDDKIILTCAGENDLELRAEIKPPPALGAEKLAVYIREPGTTGPETARPGAWTHYIQGLRTKAIAERNRAMTWKRTLANSKAGSFDAIDDSVIFTS